MTALDVGREYGTVRLFHPVYFVGVSICRGKQFDETIFLLMRDRLFIPIKIMKFHNSFSGRQRGSWLHQRTGEMRQKKFMKERTTALIAIS